MMNWVHCSARSSIATVSCIGRSRESVPVLILELRGGEVGELVEYVSTELLTYCVCVCNIVYWLNGLFGS